MDLPTIISVTYGALQITIILVTGFCSGWQVYRQRQNTGRSDIGGSGNNVKKENIATVRTADAAGQHLLLSGKNGTGADVDGSNNSGSQKCAGAKKEAQLRKKALDQSEAGGGVSMKGGDTNNDLKEEDDQLDMKVEETGSDQAAAIQGTIAGSTKSEAKDLPLPESGDGPACWRMWFDSFKSKYRMYLVLLPHVFDQATDLGAIFEFVEATALYNEKSEDEKRGTFDPTWFLRASVFVFVFQRVFSSFIIFFMTNKNWRASLLQVFDLLILRAIWVNYALDLEKPCNPQLFIELLEATFESAPQLLLSTGYLLRQSMSGELISGFVAAQAILSLVSLASKVATDDEAVFQNEYQELTVGRCPNYRWFLRVFFWRVFEISTRFVVFLLIWFAMGGPLLLFMIGVELLIFGVAAAYKKRVDFMVNVLYLTIDESNWRYFRWWTTMNFTWLYRVISNVVVLILTTVFAKARFEAVSLGVPPYTDRYSLFVEQKVGLVLLYYAWVVQFIWPWIVFYFMKTGKIKSRKVAFRSILKYAKADRPQEALQLVKFGVLLDENENDDRIVHYLADKDNADCNKQDEHGETLLHFAVKQERPETVKYLVENCNADCNKEDNSGRTPLQWAVQEKKIEMVKSMVEKGNADPPLHMAAEYGRTEIVEYLVVHCKADCNKEDESGQTPLHLAAKWGRAEIVKLLVENGKADSSKEDHFGTTPLMLARKESKADVVKYLQSTMECGH